MKRLRQPTPQAATQGCQIHRTPRSLDCGEFQVTRVIITPNDYTHKVGPRYEILDRESLVVSDNIPPQVGETKAQWQQREADNAGRAQRR